MDYRLWTMDWRSCPLFFLCAALVGCATPQYAIRPIPVPEESAAAIQIERQISTIQGKAFERQRARPIGFDEELRGLAVQQVIDRLSRVTERPSLRYRAYLATSAGGQDFATGLVERWRKMDLLGGAIEPFHPAEAELEMMPARLVQIVELVVVQVHAAGGHLVQQRLP